MSQEKQTRSGERLERRQRKLILRCMKPAFVFLLLSVFVIAFSLVYIRLPVSAPDEVTYAECGWERGGRFDSPSLVLQTSEGKEYLVAGFFSGRLSQAVEDGCIQPGDPILITTAPSLSRDVIVALTHNGTPYAEEQDLIEYRKKTLSSGLILAAILAGVGLVISGVAFLLERKELAGIRKKLAKKQKR